MWVRSGTPLIAFVTLGLPAGAIGVAWPHMRASLDAPLAGLGLLLAAWTGAYVLADASLGMLASRIRLPFLLVGGCSLAAAGLLGLAVAPSWWMVPLISLLIGGGSGLFDSAVNVHASLNRGVRYMGWLHASWAVGAALGPPLIVVSLAGTGSWQAAFVAMAAAFIGVGLIIGSRRADWAHADVPKNSDSQSDDRPSDYRRALLFLIGLFLVSNGLEATAGDWSYTQLTAARGVGTGAASFGASLLWAGLAVGRIGLGLLGNRVRPIRLLDASVGVAALAAVGFWLTPPPVATFVALPMIGLGVAVMFPLLVFITPSRVGLRMTTHAIGYGMAAGTLGAGAFPALTGLLLQSLGLLTLGAVLTLLAAALVLLHVASRLDQPRARRRQSRGHGPGPPAS
jgi:fucose permease